jgi:hypothetical protein
MGEKGRGHEFDNIRVEGIKDVSSGGCVSRK